MNGVGKIGQTCTKMKLDYLLISRTRIYSKWIKDLNIRPETIKIIEENIGSKILNIACSNNLSYISPGKENNKQTNKRDHIQLKSFCTAKETINKIKRQPTVWENIFANTSDKGLISKIYKEFTKLNTKKTNCPIEKWVKDLNRHFSKKDIQMGSRHLKRYSMALIIREMQIKTTMRYHLTPVRMAITNKSTNKKCWWGCGQKGMLLLCGGNADWCTHFGK